MQAQTEFPPMVRRFEHDCELPREEISYKLDSPYDSKFQKFFKKTRKFVTVSRKTESVGYFRSYKEFLREKMRHLETSDYKYIIHPFSLFAYYKSIYMGILFCALIVVESFVGTFMSDQLLHSELPWFELAILIANCVCFLDVVSRFFIGYTIGKTRSVVLTPKAVMKKYLFGYFFFDFAPVLGFLLFYITPSSLIKTRMCLYQFHKFRIARLKSIVHKTEKVLVRFRCREATCLLVLLGFIYFFVLYILTCLSGHFLVTRELYDIPSDQSFFNLHQHKRTDSENDTALHHFLIHLWMVSYHFLGLDDTNLKSFDNAELLFFALVTVAGLCLYLYALAKTLQFFSVINISETRYEELIMQAEDFMVQRNFPQSLKLRIFNYYNYKYNKTFFSETAILGTLSEHLKMEVLLHTCQLFIDKVQMFKGLSKSAVGCILALLKQEIYVPGDDILYSYDEIGSVYFILFGTCAVVLETGREVLHIEDGDHFTSGLDESDSGSSFFYTVKALEMAEVYKLCKEDLEYCCLVFPEIMSKLEAREKAKNRQYNKMFQLAVSAEESDDHFDDIIKELRRGKILVRGLKRQLFLD